MSFRINKAAVLGSGVMGSGIACHLANIGLEVLMLDIVPFDLKEEEKNNPASRNRIVNGALKNALKAKPAPLYDKKFASRIKTGNFDDNFAEIADCDWIIEVVVERLDIKKIIFEKVEKYRKPGSLVTSNTSGIPINQLAEGRSEDFKAHFCGTHFFNPPRYLRLLEVIPTPATTKEVVDFFMHYGDVFLGKSTVLCKDTPAFIANRIGFYSGTKMVELTDKYELRIEEVDKLTGPILSRPKTGCFRLQDLVGLDTSDKVTKGVIQNCPDDEFVKTIIGKGNPSYLDYLLENKFLGDKSGQGFYKKTNERDTNGRRIILGLDLKTMEYGPTQKPTLPSLKLQKSIEKISKRIPALMEADDKGGYFLKDYFLGLFAYASNRVPEISDALYSVDDAMRSGYAWDYGPFEYWDMYGVKNGVEAAEQNGESVASWVKDMLGKGIESFYKIEDGVRKYYDILSGNFKTIPGSVNIVVLDNYRQKEAILQNSECTLHDIGDGVLCLEFTSKANAIGEGIGEGLVEAVNIAENGDWKGIVIGNNAKNFTVGANLLGVGMLAMQKDFETLEKMVDGFQQVNMRLRYSSIPVVTATQGYCFGGGCEILMHTDAGVCAAESYIGLVEVGVGLLPGGGGTKEFALRASNEYFPGDVQIPTLIEKFRAIATASVGTSAYEAYNYGYLQADRDTVVVNTTRVLTEAKK
jgi:3-hydroxyacyl-CoA dehydrogenase